MQTLLSELYPQAITEASLGQFDLYAQILSGIPKIDNKPLRYKYKKLAVNPLRRMAFAMDLMHDTDTSLFIRGDGKDGDYPTPKEWIALNYDKENQIWGSKTSLDYGKTLQEIPNYEANSFLFQLTELVTEGKLPDDPVPYFELALEKGADVNHVDKNGNTVLHKLSHYFKKESNTNLELIDLLIKNGANVNARDSKGETALLISIKNRNSIMAGYLKKNGANIEIENNKGVSPLSLAGDKNDFEMVRLLLGYHIPEDITTFPKSVQKLIQKERARVIRAQEWATYSHENPNSPWNWVPQSLRFGKKVRRSKHRRNYKSKRNASLKR
jgi:hypothetical protein